MNEINGLQNRVAWALWGAFCLQACEDAGFPFLILTFFTPDLLLALQDRAGSSLPGIT